MNKQIILTREHRGRSSKGTSFTGRPEGQQVREELSLSEKDRDEYTYEIVMPEDTTSFNPSFYLGLLFDSVKKLGWDAFSRKYQFNLDNFSESLRAEIRIGLDDCERRAKNELAGKTGIDI
ncbi:MAG: hypothetical protein IJQ84_04635 [Paludibacteraceae bacterium]|nr:hypothetical protein [Paludibacteraceae bacterium]